MEDSGTMSWEQFLASLSQILEISNRIEDGWKMSGSQSVPGAAYLVKKMSLKVDAPSTATSLLDFEEPLENILHDASVGIELPRITATVEYHIVYSQSYAVPVLYFNHWKADGRLLTLDETWQNVHPSFKSSFEQDKWQILTQQEHPIERRPFFQLHPCKTAELLKCVNTSVNPVVTWLSSVGPAVGLELNEAYANLVL